MIFLLGALLPLAPLILFNLRHNFIMLQGFKRSIFSDQVITRQSQTFLGKINNGLKTFSDLAQPLLHLPTLGKLNNLIVFLLFFILPGLWIYKKSKTKLQKFMAVYFLFNCLFGLIVLTLIDQEGYPSTAFYIWFLVPLVLIIWSQFIIILFGKKQFTPILDQ